MDKCVVFAETLWKTIHPIYEHSGNNLCPVAEHSENEP